MWLTPYNDHHEDFGVRARRAAKAASTSSFVAPFPARMEAPAGFDFLAQKGVVVSGFALSSHILAEQFPGDLGRWLVRCLGFGHELVTQFGFQLQSEDGFFRHNAGSLQ
jgi:hypothetical protein